MQTSAFVRLRTTCPYNNLTSRNLTSNYYCAMIGFFTLPLLGAPPFYLGWVVDTIHRPVNAFGWVVDTTRIPASVALGCVVDITHRHVNAFGWVVDTTRTPASVALGWVMDSTHIPAKAEPEAGLNKSCFTFPFCADPHMSFQHPNVPAVGSSDPAHKSFILVKIRSQVRKIMQFQMSRIQMNTVQLR